MWQAAEKLKAAGINPRTKEPYKRPCGSYKKLPPEEAAAAAALKAAQVAHKAGEKKAIEKETIATLRGKVATLEAELVLCRARLAPPGPKRPNQQVEERGGPGEENTGLANRPARARLRHIGRPAHSTLTAGPGQEGLPGGPVLREAGRRGENRPGKSTLGGPGAATFDPAGAPAGPEPDPPPGPAPPSTVPSGGGAPVISGGFLE